MQRGGWRGHRAGIPGEDGLISGTVQIVALVVILFPLDVRREWHAARRSSSANAGVGGSTAIRYSPSSSFSTTRAEMLASSEK